MHESTENIVSGAKSRLVPIIDRFTEEHDLDDDMAAAIVQFATDAFGIGAAVGASEVAAQVTKQAQASGIDFRFDIQVTDFPGFPSTDED